MWICIQLTKQKIADTDKTKEDIEGAKKELKKAKILRKNKEEYDLLVDVINEQPDRKKLRLMYLNFLQELQALEERSKEWDKEFEAHRRQFHVLLTSQRDLHALLQDSDM